MIARAQILHEYLNGIKKVYGQGELVFDEDFQVPDACPYSLEFIYENELANEKIEEYDSELGIKDVE